MVKLLLMPFAAGALLSATGLVRGGRPIFPHEIDTTALARGDAEVVVNSKKAGR
ncbi:hypothetical protein GP2143_04208 [marine gamma proteobacterium HTCC2143]|jgi:hypothetical protein|uniref:Uncharacterized protein n=1 Tax=marine gamma proteobacterium HTCC2143 TaxID=247633 RepID=A0YDJ3_9GAMM|nr:hypothetical protein GP2143_04208 [marine gamma proteobacterium HTCC2143]